MKVFLTNCVAMFNRPNDLIVVFDQYDYDYDYDYDYYYDYDYDYDYGPSDHFSKICQHFFSMTSLQILLTVRLSGYV